MMIADDYRHCVELVHQADKNRFLSALFASGDRRPALMALYAFNIEISRIPSIAHDPFAAAVRLQWWREALLGERDGEAAANPVAAALRDALIGAQIDPAPAIEYLEVQRAIAFGEPENATEAAIFFIAARLLGAPETGLGAASASAGQAYALAMRAQSPEIARVQYAALRVQVGYLPKIALPAFLPAALVPLLLAQPNASQWRRQLAMLRAAWIGFPSG
jgi:phytoene/squalene synthetase